MWYMASCIRGLSFHTLPGQSPQCQCPADFFLVGPLILAKKLLLCLLCDFYLTVCEQQRKIGEDGLTLSCE